MCGRYQRKSDKPKIAEAFQLDALDPFELDLAPTYNAAPQSLQPVIVWDQQLGTRMLQMMFWRFLPPYVTDPKAFKLDTILARGENLLSNNTWRNAFLHRRCLVPVDSFVEWQRPDAKTKLPWMFSMKDDQPFALAGIYQCWRSQNRETEMDTFAVITTEANELMVETSGHDRMPVIIKRQDYERWLSPEHSDRPPIDLVRPYASELMKAWRVDKRINNTRNNEPSLCERLAQPDIPSQAESPLQQNNSAEQSEMEGKSDQLSMF